MLSFSIDMIVQRGLGISYLPFSITRKLRAQILFSAREIKMADYERVIANIMVKYHHIHTIIADQKYLHE